jgi:probable HAF family extracellular repeat protein
MNSSRVVLLAVIGAGTLWSQQPVYHVTDLGTLTGTTSSANGISNNGTYITGQFRNGSVTHAFSYSAASGAVDLGALGSYSTGLAINNTGQVAGYTAPSEDHAFLYSGGIMMDLGTIAGGTSASSFGYGINNSGQVVGYSNPNTTNYHQYDPFLYSNGTMQDLGLPPGASTSFGAAAYAINDTGEIAGYYTPDSATTHAFTLIGGVYTDLGTLNGTASGTTSSAVCISSTGLVAGSSVRADGSTHAFLYTGGQMVDLGTIASTVSRASSVNSNGDVVGESFWSGSGFHAFLYHGGAMLDLNTLLDAASAGFTISDGTGISDGGAIAATGTVTSGGPTHALLLTPVSVSPQTITFDAIPNQIFGGSPFPIAVQASSGLPVTITSTTPAVCKNATGLVMLLSAGPCSLTATQNGSISFSPATAMVRSFTVTTANPSGTLQPATGSPFAVGTGPRSVAVGDFNGDGKPDLVTANYADGTVSVLLANTSGGYTAATGSPFQVGTNPQSVAVGDFNGDGFQDLAVANSGSNNVTVLLGNVSGGFTAASGGPITVGLQPVYIAVGDFNGDGIQDLAVANFSAGTVSVLLGNGSGGFAAATGSPFTVGTNPLSLAVADFNGDGAQDLAVANFGSNSVTVLLASNGGFTAATGSPFSVGSSPYSVVVGDFDGNGIPDIATANSGSANVTVLLGNVSGGFTAATGSPFSAGTNPYSIVVADFNGDGIPDLAAANYGSNNVTMLLGNGSGGFTAGVGGPIGVGNSPFALAVADFNGDGIPDLASANYGAGNVTVLLGGKVSTTSALTTTSPLLVALGQAVPLTLMVSDNAAPFATLTGTATFLDGTTTLGAASQTGSPYTFSTSSLSAGNHTLSATYSGDTRTAGSTSNTITIQVSATLSAQTIAFGALANQTIGATPPALIATASSGLTLSFASNTPGACTVTGTAVTLVAPGTCSITASQLGNGQFVPAPPVTQTFLVLNANAISFDAIPNQIFGISPFVTAAKSSAGLPVTFVSTTPAVCSNASNLIILLGVGTCTISASQSGNLSYAPAPTVLRSFTVKLGPSAALTAAAGSPFMVGSSPNAVAAADFNGDGNPDLAVANEGGNNVTVLMGNGSGGFTPFSASPFAVGAAPASITAGDFNADGKPDFAVANFNDGTVTVYLGNGQGGFTATPGSPITVGKQPSGIAVGDFNNDGIQDLGIANLSDGTLTVLLGDGMGNFTAAPGNPFTAAGASAKSLALADFNSDGTQDLAVADEAFVTGTLPVLIGTGTGGFNAASYSPLPGGDLIDSVVVADFNGDGIPDLAAPSLIFNNVVVLLGNKSGGFTAATGSPFGLGSNPAAIVAGDFNGDGIPDLASANGDGTVTLLLGNGLGGFAPAVGSPFTVPGASALAVGDFNKDGIEDLAVTNSGTGTVTVLLGGQFATTSVLTTTSPATIFVGQSVPLTLTVSETGTPFNPLSGTATLLDGTTALGTATQTGSPYTFTANLAAGNHTLTASYGGGSGASASISNSIAILALSPCDINTDQVTNIADVQLAINEALGLKAAANDLDGSGIVNVVDIQIVLNAVNNLGCSAKTM